MKKIFDLIITYSYDPLHRYNALVSGHHMLPDPPPYNPQYFQTLAQQRRSSPREGKNMFVIRQDKLFKNQT